MLPTNNIRKGGKTSKATKINRPVANTVLRRITKSFKKYRHQQNSKNYSVDHTILRIRFSGRRKWLRTSDTICLVLLESRCPRRGAIGPCQLTIPRGPLSRLSWRE